MFKHILLPTDGSTLSDAAIESGEIPGGFKEESAGEFRANAKLHLAALAKLAEGVGVACDEVFEASEQPYEAIIRTAEEKGCDLILMASHGKRGIQALLLGSETQKVLAHSRIPVLVYR
jgi:nucleotide-binding universal stress UspA family protein